MTVSELIKILNKLPKDYVVGINNEQDTLLYNISELSAIPNKKVIVLSGNNISSIKVINKIIIT